MHNPWQGILEPHRRVREPRHHGFEPKNIPARSRERARRRSRRAGRAAASPTETRRSIRGRRRRRHVIRPEEHAAQEGGVSAGPFLLPATAGRRGGGGGEVEQVEVGSDPARNEAVAVDHLRR